MDLVLSFVPKGSPRVRFIIVSPWSHPHKWGEYWQERMSTEVSWSWLPLKPPFCGPRFCRVFDLLLILFAFGS